MLQYYQAGTCYSGGLRKIKQHFFSNVTPELSFGDSGYLTIRFIVHEDGTITIVDILHCSKEFRPFRFNDNLVDELILCLHQLGRWNPGTVQNQPIKSMKYLTFIIQNGLVVDIVPK